MDITAFMLTDAYTWILLPLLIFLARICDVSLGTMRVIFIARGFKFLAPILGFFEVIIWLLAVRQIIVMIPNWLCFIAYAAGFATGNFVGMLIEEKLSVGKVVFRVITRHDPSKLVSELKSHGHIVTTSAAKNQEGDVQVIFMVLERHDVNSVLNLVKEFNPNAFYVIEDVRYAADKAPKSHFHPRMFSFFKMGK